MAKIHLKEILLSLSLTVASIVGSYLAVEGVLRIKNSAMDVYDIEMWRYSKLLKKRSDDPVLGHEHVKSSSAVLQKVDIRINEFGLRGGPLPPPAPGQRRVLFLGSSITLGWGVEEEKTMTARLQRMFERDGKNAVVMNGGIGNYNIVRYVKRFHTSLAALKPTDIVLNVFVNDAEELEAGGGNLLLRHSQLAVTVWRVANRYLTPQGEGALLDHYRAVYAEGSPSRIAMTASLKRLGDYARDNGIRLYIAMTPDIHNLADYKFTFIHRIYETLAHEFGYRFIDLLPVMSGIEPRDIWAMAGDPHPNALGHELMAKAIYEVLSRAP